MSRTPGTTAATPTRDLAVDYYRVSGVMLIVFGHWLLSSITYVDGAFDRENPLVDIPWTQWLTWPLQAVPVFFLAAGYASAVSWSHWVESGKMGRQDWVRRRLTTTLGPTAAYLGFIWVIIVVAGAFGAPGAVLEYAGWAVAMQLWFLSVYSMVVYLTPLGMALHRRFGLWIPAACGVGVGVVDLLTYAGGVPYLNWINYLFCWGAMYQLGLAWRDGMLRGWRPVALAAVSGPALLALVLIGPYPVSMIAIPGQEVQNSSPPSLAILFLGLTQTGVAAALAPVVHRAMSGRLKPALSVANTNVMALYLWHMVPVVVVAAVAYPAGLLPQYPENSAQWWWMRLVWVLILAVVTAGELLALHRMRRFFAAPLPPIRVNAPDRWTELSLLAGVVMAGYGISVVAASGFAPGGSVSWHAVILFVLGSALVAVESRQAPASPASG